MSDYVKVNRHSLLGYLTLTRKIGGPYSKSLRSELDAALADAEPAPDSGQSESVRNLYAEAVDWLMKADTPAAEPVRATLPDTITDEPLTLYTVITDAHNQDYVRIEGPYSPWHMITSDAQPFLSWEDIPKPVTVEAVPQPPKADPAAEPVRATLPDTPWTTIRGEVPGWGTVFLKTEWNVGEWFLLAGETAGEDQVAAIESYEILAEPPKADPAETDGETYTQAEVADLTSQAYRDGQRLAEDRAAKRGRDEALAVVVKALHTFADDDGIVVNWDMRQLAVDIERERGGDGR